VVLDAFAGFNTIGFVPETLQHRCISFEINEMVKMNTKLVESLIQVILSLSDEDRSLLEEKLFFNSSEPSTRDLMLLAQTGGTFNFLENEPDIYSLDDGEPI
jgi:hypothetical protein